MIGSVRPSLLRAVPRQIRTMITKSDRWTSVSNQQGQQMLQADAADLKKLLPNLENHWMTMPKEEQYAIFKMLEEIQRKNWKELSMDEKKGGMLSRAGIPADL